MPYFAAFLHTAFIISVPHISRITSFTQPPCRFFIEECHELTGRHAYGFLRRQCDTAYEVSIARGQRCRDECAARPDSVATFSRRFRRVAASFRCFYDSPRANISIRHYYAPTASAHKHDRRQHTFAPHARVKADVETFDMPSPTI